ncbi:hypothetical protein VB715_09295 [Crocosphaera sp. UHCC 0190]|uniref:hypothetical protein n=1 Tax=Crocosphaera sp. UHCC 0190 TaxID=3110246 RepID=UPI002B1FC6C9|nr:hypothetical protein [Crocosphaera sp. UHCC 0190]MEA5509958.1 hypothetical protein [Crocosphaera sp. UHCC 0190]
MKILPWLLISLVVTLSFWIQPVAVAKQVNPDTATSAILVCFSGGQEIIRKTVLEGPFADEYKFAHEVKVMDKKGEHRFNFSGGLCIIDQGIVATKKKLDLTNELSCYSGANKVVEFEVYGQETTVDEYLEGRTFLAKTQGNSINSESIHRYLVFGGGACLGEEIN